MKNSNQIHIAIVGNPNCGKSSLFNYLTGLKQKVGNFPGVTVEKKVGSFTLRENTTAHVVDLPGMYSLYPRREDEWVAYKALMQNDSSFPIDIVLVVIDASNLKRNLLFCSQLIELNYKVVVAMTMTDIAKQKGINIDTEGLSRDLNVPVVAINPRKGKGINELTKVLYTTSQNKIPAKSSAFINDENINIKAFNDLQSIVPCKSDYEALHILLNNQTIIENNNTKQTVESIREKYGLNAIKIQAKEVLYRYKKINQLIQNNVTEPDPLKKKIFTERIDDILLHRTWGYLILLLVIFILFQSIFWLASYPMDGIEWFFSTLTEKLSTILPNNTITDVLLNGVLAGVGGTVVFVPQIMILFGLITILEDTGYMSRVSFLMDKLMRKVGLNGKSVMPMISGFACAIPAIMAARSIESKKERWLTILITPLMSCSARLPIYVILISLVIPEKNIAGFLSLQGLVMMGLYLMGFVVSLLVSLIAKYFINTKEKSFFILELPIYKTPRWKTVVLTMFDKAKIFLVQSGKIIVMVSILIWFLGNYGPSKQMQIVENKYTHLIQNSPSEEHATLLEKEFNAEKLENSYAGILGKSIEPIIAPLGFDWKMGIAIITSFAAREVFVATMATLYATEEDDDSTLREKMLEARRSDGTPTYTLGTGISLMLFYVFAMQCLSTLVVVRKETQSILFPTIQFIYMTALAYLFSYLAYHLF